MQLVIGTYSFDANAVDISTQLETLWTAGGQAYAQRKVFNIKGMLQSSTQAAMAIAMNALATALAKQFQDLTFQLDSGAASYAVLLNAGSTTGVRIHGLNFPTESGSGYSTTKTFEFTAEAEYPISGSANFLIEWKESVTFSGGGPTKVCVPAVNDVPPQRQTIYAQTPYRATQSGSAVGYRKRPDPPPPIWPDDLKQSPDITPSSAELKGQIFTNYPISWSYIFESPTPLVGLPTLWPGVTAIGPR